MHEFGIWIHGRLNQVMEAMRIKCPGLSEYFDEQKDRREEEMAMDKKIIDELERDLMYERYAREVEKTAAKDRLDGQKDLYDSLDLERRFWENQATGNKVGCTETLNQLRQNVASCVDKLTCKTSEVQDLKRDVRDLGNKLRTAEAERNDFQLQKATTLMDAEKDKDAAEATISSLRKDMDTIKTNEQSVIKACEDANVGGASEQTVAYLRDVNRENERANARLRNLEMQITCLQKKTEEQEVEISTTRLGRMFANGEPTSTTLIQRLVEDFQKYTRDERRRRS